MFPEKKNNTKNIKFMICSNCSNHGHDYKHCNEPITSWGIILIKTTKKENENENENGNGNGNKIKSDIDIEESSSLYLENINDLNKVCTYFDFVKFLLIRRRHSLGYSEFIRGRYIKDNIEGIIYLFQQMTPEEIYDIKTKEFEELWYTFWGDDNKKINLNKKEYIESSEKFYSLKKKEGVELPLNFYTENVKPLYELPEWGFPKGRKNRGESNMECAMREFHEETNIPYDLVKILTNVKPIIENMIGTNGVSYRHVYYLAEYLGNDEEISVNGNNEIGDIDFFSYDNAYKSIREYHIEKKNIIRNVFMYYTNILLHGEETILDELSINDEELWETTNDLF
jgi:8-oxo-dGTP pyrophosphatase MutT (NUDIX family)